MRITVDSLDGVVLCGNKNVILLEDTDLSPDSSDNQFSVQFVQSSCGDLENKDINVQFVQWFAIKGVMKSS